MAQNKVCVLLATYNGEKYISSQIESIIKQTYKDWHLIIRDDGSDDKTPLILKKWSEKYPQKITLYFNKESIHGATNNFWQLSKLAITKNYQYIMFCDQDDIWLKDKIEKSVSAIKNKEIQFGEIPILVHTDLIVVDQELNIINRSYEKYASLNFRRKDINHLLIQNNVTGCTMILNKALLKKALECRNSNYIILHDWWFTLVASIYGKIFYLGIPTVLYRQHNHNVVGAEKVNSIRFVFSKLSNIKLIRESLKKSMKQANLIVDTYNDISDTQKNIIEEYSNLQFKSKIKKCFLITKYSFFKQSIIKIIAEYIFI